MRNRAGARRGATHLILALAVLLACSSQESAGPPRLVFPGSRVGEEGHALEQALARFRELHPEIEVELRATPDSADERHQLYLAWLSAGEATPDILQLDAIWVAEFAAAGWILNLEPFSVTPDVYFAAPARADTWAGSLYALPWFVDVGLLYWRTDLVDAAPTRFEELADEARRRRDAAQLPYGLVWPAARYEGLITVFLEYLTGFGGEILDGQGSVVVDSPEAVRALDAMRAAIAPGGIVPREALAWTEERVRLAFQSGRAVFMRNWPYAYPLLQESADSPVRGRVAVAPMPAGPGGRQSAALGGQQLAINRHTRYPEAAVALIQFLTSPGEMLARAEVTGQYPARPEVYADPALARALPVDPQRVRAIIEQAVARPQIPVYSELSEILQIHLHRALEGSDTPASALREAADRMREVLARSRSVSRDPNDVPSVSSDGGREDRRANVD